MPASKRYKNMTSTAADNFQTPPEALVCLVPWLERAKIEIIWEPASGNGNLVRALNDDLFVCYGTDISAGHDFLKIEMPQAEAIVTNPPYSKKDEFLARCYALGKPFALLLPMTTFDSYKRRALMRAHGVQIILPPRRFSFETPNQSKRAAEGKKSSSWFYTAWFTWGFNLPRDIIYPGDTP